MREDPERLGGRVDAYLTGCMVCAVMIAGSLLLAEPTDEERGEVSARLGVAIWTGLAAAYYRWRLWRDAR
jgi:hypothetical protein